MTHKDNIEKRNIRNGKVRYFCGGIKRVNLEDFDENGRYKYNDGNLKFEYDAHKKDVNVFLALRRLGLLEDGLFSVTHFNDENIKR